MRSQAEILERIEQAYDPFIWQQPVLVECLDFEHARQFLIADATADGWAFEQCLTDEQAIARMRESMPYAWQQVIDHQGRTANRSVEKLIAWLFVLGDDETLLGMMGRPFAMWGAPRLRFVCDRYEFPVPSERTVRRMSEGKKCRRTCDRGCGS